VDFLCWEGSNEREKEKNVMNFNDFISLFFVSGFIALACYMILLGIRGMFPHE